MYKKLIYYFKYGLAVLILLVVGLFACNIKLHAADCQLVMAYSGSPDFSGYTLFESRSDTSMYSTDTEIEWDFDNTNIRKKQVMFVFNDGSSGVGTDLIYLLKEPTYVIIDNFIPDARYSIGYEISFNSINSGTIHFSGSTKKLSFVFKGDDIAWSGLGIEVYYKGTADELEPVISTDKYIYITSVDNPTTIQNMMTAVNLTAMDEIDGDLTSRIQTVSDGGYATNILNKTDIKQRILGDYAINFSVTDNSDNTATCTIIIRVLDTTKPVINTSTSTLTYSVGYNNPTLTLDTIKNGIIVTDNHSNNIIKTIIEDNYTSNKNKVGAYTVKVQCKDDSSNYVVATVTVTVYDNVKPIFTGANTFYKSYDVAKSTTDIITFCNVIATDEIDGQLTIANGKLKVLTDNYTGKSNIPGTYTIVLRATDTRGNYNDFTITITVGDDVIPYFLINRNKIIIESGVNFTSAMLVKTLKDVNIISNKSLSYSVIKDTYSGNEDVPGEYDYNLKVLYNDGIEDYVDLKVQVLEADDNGTNVPKDKQNIFIRIWNFIKQLFIWIWNALKWIWNGLVKCWNWISGLFKKEALVYFLKL